MSIQLINLGTAPKGVDGDTQRTANQKMNANIQYLNAQTSAAKQTAATALTKATEAANSAKDTASKAFAKTGGDITGVTAVRYGGGSTGSTLTIDNTNGTRGSLDIAAGGVPKGGLSVYKQGNEYIVSITGTHNDASSDARAGLMTLGKNNVWTQAYGNLHDYFVKKNTLEAIRTIGEGRVSGNVVESQGFASEIRNRGVHLFIREVSGQYSESVIRTYANNIGAKDFTFRYDGNAYAPGAWVNASDIRLKDKIMPLAGMRALLDRIQPIHYHHRLTGQDSVGYSAQELQDILPCCVHTVGYVATPEGDELTDTLALNYNAMTAVNTQIIKEQDAVIRSLLARVAALEKVLEARASD